MFRRIIGVLAILALCSSAAIAQEKREPQESGLGAWLRNMRHKLDIVNPRKTLPVSTGVAGVRGAKDQSKAKLYWKGKEGDEHVSEAELAALKAVVELAEQGDHGGAAKGCAAFLEQFPDSALVPDAKRTLDLVKAAPKTEPKADVTSERMDSVSSTIEAQAETPLSIGEAPATGTK